MAQRAHVNADLLVWARESINLPLADAARKLGVSEERLELWESGEGEPTIRQLRDASRVYKRPLAAFYLPERPYHFHVPKDYRTLPDTSPAPLSPEFCNEFRWASYRRDLALECAAPEEIETYSREYVGTVRLNASPNRVAQVARDMLGVSIQEQLTWSTPYEALNAWIAALERLGVLVFHFARVSVDEVRGFATCETPFPVIGINSADAPNGRIFTLMHEFCHLLLGEAGISDLRSYRATVTRDQRVELFCNNVAGLTLVPTGNLTEELGISGTPNPREWRDEQLRQLALRYSVSRAVILRRLWMLDATTDDFFWNTISALGRFSQPAKKGGFAPVPRRTVRACGRTYTRLVLDAYDREAITSSDLADYLGVKLRHLPDIRRLVTQPLAQAGATA